MKQMEFLAISMKNKQIEIEFVGGVCGTITTTYQHGFNYIPKPGVIIYETNQDNECNEEGIYPDK